MKGDEGIEVVKKLAKPALLIKTWNKCDGFVNCFFRLTGQPSRFILGFPINIQERAMNEFKVHVLFWNRIKQRVNRPKWSL